MNMCKNYCTNCKTLCGYIHEEGVDYDVYDTVFDACVTISLPDVLLSTADYYDKFCCEICSKVNCEGKGGYDASLIADWCGFIEKNFDKFKEFTRKYWKRDYSDKDDFIYNWITEFQHYFSGDVPEDFYKALYEFAVTLN